MTITERRRRFRELHASGTFVVPNPWDVGSARVLEQLGFPALATTSSAYAASLGRADQQLALGELVEHVAALTAAVEVPLTVDAEHGYAAAAGGIADTVALLAEAGASGLSLEDFDPVRGEVVPLPEALERVVAGVEAARVHDLVLTARAENHLYGHGDLDDTITRLQAYAAAGADVVYAPGLSAPADLTRLVAETGAPVNVLAVPGTPPVPELARLGVRRVSTGGALAWAAYGALAEHAGALLGDGEYAHLGRGIDPGLRERAFRG